LGTTWNRSLRITFSKDSDAFRSTFVKLCV